MVKKTVFVIISLFASCALLVSLDTPKPKIFVIGDSISIQYGPYLKQALEGFFEYDRKRGVKHALKDLDNPVGANGGDSRMVLEYLRKLVDSANFNTDYLLINCGLHDIKTNPKTNNIQIPLSEYKQNLEQIVQLTQKMKTQMIWVNSTPVIDTIHNRGVGFRRFASDLKEYNQASTAIMKKYRVPIIDLFSFTQKFGADAYIDHVHYKTGIREKQADFIAGFLSHLQTEN